MVGRGAVGRFLGERIAATGAEVVYAPRELAAVEPVAADLAIVAVKATATASAIETLRRALPDDDATVLTPQNGVGNEERLAEAFGRDRIVSAALTVQVELTPSGDVVAANRGGIVLAPVGDVAHNYLIAAFERTGIPTSVASDYRALKWSKLVLNIVANASCAILDVLPEALVRDPALFALEIRAIREAGGVMDACGIATIDLPRYPVRALRAIARLPMPAARAILAGRIAGARGRKPPSLLLDMRAGRETEVAFLNGAVTATARAHGLGAPVNAAFAGLVPILAASKAERARFRERPRALLEAIAAAEHPGAPVLP